jgi:uncharacterized paraquat-inducible protein A
VGAHDTRTSGKRPWIAVLLAILYPGLGHLYLREWIRGIMWFGLVVSSVMLLLPADAFPETVSVDAYLSAAAAIPLHVSLAIVALSALSVADAYWLARRAATPAAVADGETRSCPNCGKELDEDLDFCHWCTTRLVEEPPDDGAA